MKKYILVPLIILCSCQSNSNSGQRKELSDSIKTRSHRKEVKTDQTENFEHLKNKTKDFIYWYGAFIDTLNVTTGHAPDDDNGMYVKNKNEYLDGLRGSGYVSEQLVEKLKVIYDDCESINEGDNMDRLGCLDGDNFVSDGNKKTNLNIIFEDIQSYDGVVKIYFKMSYIVLGKYPENSNLVYTYKEIDGKWLIDSTDGYEELESIYGVEK